MRKDGRPSLRFVAPDPRLTLFVRNYWLLDSGSDAASETRYLHPDGGSGLSFSLGEPVVIDGERRAPGVQARGRLLGPSTWSLGAGTHMIGVRFRPGGSVPFFGRAPLEDEATSELRGLLERVEEATTCRARVAILDAWLIERCRPELLSATTLAAVAALRESRLPLRIGELADRFGLTGRHLERLFHDEVGYSPKQLGRIFRARRAKRILAGSPGIELTALAYTLGYADQAHLTREFKSIIGITPARYRRLRQGLETP